MQKLKCRTAYTARDEDNEGIIFPSDSLVQRHFQDECDVNLIVDRYVKTGVMDHINETPPTYGDVSEVPTDLMSSYEAVFAAEQAFMNLPSGLRKSLDNDPSRLGAWLQDEKNYDDAVKYGLLAVSQVVQHEKTNVETNEGSKSESKSSET